MLTFTQINGILSLKWRYYGPKSIFWTIGEHLYLGLLSSYIFYRDRVYSVETMDMGNIPLKNTDNVI